MKAMAVNKQREYLIHEDGTVTKFLFGVDEVSERNYCYIVGKVKPREMPDDFDSSLYDGYSPLYCSLIETYKENLYRLEV